MSGQCIPDYQTQGLILNSTNRVANLERALIMVLDTFKQTSPGIDARHAAYLAEGSCR
jgi:hypothetical protein